MVGLIMCFVLMSLYPIKLEGYVIESIFCFLGFILLVVGLLTSICSIIVLILVHWFWVRSLGRASFIFLVR